VVKCIAESTYIVDLARSFEDKTSLLSICSRSWSVVIGMRCECRFGVWVWIYL